MNVAIEFCTLPQNFHRYFHIQSSNNCLSLVTQLYLLQFEDEESEEQQVKFLPQIYEITKPRPSTGLFVQPSVTSTYFHSFLGQPNSLSLFCHNYAMYMFLGIKLLYNSPNFSIYCVFLSYPHTIYYFSVIDFMMDLIFSTGNCLPLRNVTCQVYQFLQ